MFGDVLKFNELTKSIRNDILAKDECRKYNIH